MMGQDDITRLTIGEPFPLPFVSGDFGSYFHAEHLLFTVWISNPSSHELHQYTAGKAHFGLFPFSPTLCFLVTRFGDMPWVDVPHSASIEPADRRHYAWAQQDAAASHLFMKIALVESVTKVVLHLRAFTLDPVFSSAFCRCVQEQARHTLTMDDYLASIKRAYGVFSTPDQIAHAAVVTSRSGA